MTEPHKELIGYIKYLLRHIMIAKNSDVQHSNLCNVKTYLQEANNEIFKARQLTNRYKLFKIGWKMLTTLSFASFIWFYSAFLYDSKPYYNSRLFWLSWGSVMLSYYCYKKVNTTEECINELSTYVEEADRTFKKLLL